MAESRKREPPFTILVVDDEETIREVVREFLASCGYHVLEAADGSAATELVRHHQHLIHLLITDLVMPGIKGPELAWVLRILRPRMKVLFMSGGGPDAKGSALLGYPLLRKPFSKEAFVQAVQQLLDD